MLQLLLAAVQLPVDPPQLRTALQFTQPALLPAPPPRLAVAADFLLAASHVALVPVLMPLTALYFYVFQRYWRFGHV